MSTPTRKSYPSDVTDAEWEFLLPYLTLMREDALQREYSLRDLFNAIRYVVRTGCQWRYLPHDLPPSTAVYQQARRWLQASSGSRATSPVGSLTYPQGTSRINAHQLALCSRPRSNRLCIRTNSYSLMVPLKPSRRRSSGSRGS